MAVIPDSIQVSARTVNGEYELGWSLDTDDGRRFAGILPTGHRIGGEWTLPETHQLMCRFAASVAASVQNILSDT